MRSTFLGGLLVALLIVVAAGAVNFTEVLAQRPGAPASSLSGETLLSPDLVSHSVEMADGRQQITLIDARRGAMAVYQVDPRSGAIALKSVRSVQWDLQMDEFNSGGNPSPREIRSLLEQR